MKTKTGSSPFLYTDDNKRYHTLAYDNRRRFGRRVQKAVVDAGFSCPHMDSGGCVFCADGSGSFADSRLTVREQIARERLRIRQKWPDAGILVYFQAHTNTFAPLEQLRALYGMAADMEEVEGISIATRPDCLPPATVAYLSELARRIPLTVELGLQTIHDGTAKRINRGYETACFFEAFSVLKEQGIRVCVHLIDGLPGEDEGAMLESAKALGRLRPDGVKLHLLHILKGTAMADDWAAGKVPVMERDAYIATVCSQLEVLPPETVIERLTGDGPQDKLLAPQWSRNKIAVLAGIDRELARRDTWQGRLFEG